jgi:predicted dinucleotide-binding enzyme
VTVDGEPAQERLLHAETLREETAVKIGVIGGGSVGGGLATFWRDAGHDVQVSTRDTVAETAAHGEVVLLAVPAKAVDEALAAAGSLDGKVLIDATNDVGRERESQAAHVAALAPGAKLVKAFNAAFASLYDDVARTVRPPELVFCGDDAAAKETVAALIRDAHYEPVDVGGLEWAPAIESFARMIIHLAYGQGRGPFVYRFVQP